jgi:hypothetical protein
MVVVAKVENRYREGFGFSMWMGKLRPTQRTKKKLDIG